MKNRLQNFILSVMLLTGLSLLLYPSFSNYWNSFHSSKAISNYTQIVSEMDEEEYQRLLAEADAREEEYRKQREEKKSAKHKADEEITHTLLAAADAAELTEPTEETTDSGTDAEETENQTDKE